MLRFACFSGVAWLVAGMVRNEVLRKSDTVLFQLRDELNWAETPPIPDRFFFTVEFAFPEFYKLGLLPVFDIRSYSTLDMVSNCSNIERSLTFDKLQQFLAKDDQLALERSFVQNGWTSAVFIDGSVQWRWTQTLETLFTCVAPDNLKLISGDLQFLDAIVGSFCVVFVDINSGEVQYARAYTVVWLMDTTFAQGYYEAEVKNASLVDCIDDAQLAEQLQKNIANDNGPAKLYTLTIFEQDGCDTPYLGAKTFDFRGTEICLQLTVPWNFSYHTVHFYSAGCSPEGICYHSARWCANHNTSCGEECQAGYESRGAAEECSHLQLYPDGGWGSYKVSRINV